MKQGQILELLKELAEPDCTLRRCATIHGLLTDAAAGGNTVEDDMKGGMAVIMDALFVQTMMNNSALFPSLFPIFAMICGDREDPADSMTEKVEWELMKKT